MPTAMVSVQSRMTQLEECDPKLYLCSIYALTNRARADPPNPLACVPIEAASVQGRPTAARSTRHGPAVQQRCAAIARGAPNLQLSRLLRHFAAGRQRHAQFAVGIAAGAEPGDEVLDP